MPMYQVNNFGWKDMELPYANLEELIATVRANRASLLAPALEPIAKMVRDNWGGMFHNASLEKGKLIPANPHNQDHKLQLMGVGIRDYSDDVLEIACGYILWRERGKGFKKERVDTLTFKFMPGN